MKQPHKPTDSHTKRQHATASANMNIDFFSDKLVEKQF